MAFRPHFGFLRIFPCAVYLAGIAVFDIGDIDHQPCHFSAILNMALFFGLGAFVKLFYGSLTTQ